MMDNSKITSKQLLLNQTEEIKDKSSDRFNLRKFLQDKTNKNVNKHPQVKDMIIEAEKINSKYLFE